MQLIPEEQVVGRLRAENPWWSSGQVPSQITEWTPRPYLNLLYPLLVEQAVRRAVVLLGPRRVGKTVMIHHAIQRLLRDGVPPRAIAYFSVDHPIYTGLRLDQLLELCDTARGEPDKSVQFVFFDEIQYLREWERHLKALVDDQLETRFVASGSAAAALRLKSDESGAGRFTDFSLPPLTFFEYLELLGKGGLVDRGSDTGNARGSTSNIEALDDQFEAYVNFGGYPEVVLNDEIRKDPGRFIKGDIIDKVLLRDLPSLYGIQDIPELNYLFTTLAYGTGNETSLEGLSRGAGVAKNTLKRYIEYLEAAFLVRTLSRIDRSGKRFKRQNYFKVYLSNPSMRTALFEPVGRNDEAFGGMVETAVFSQWSHSDAQLFYARWRKGEVDLVCLERDQRVRFAVETKYSDRIVDHPEELTELVGFARKHDLRKVLITTRTRTASLERDGVTMDFVPVSLYAHAVGANLIAGKSARLGR